MKKITKSLFLLTAICLMSCGNNNSGTNSSAPTSSIPVSESSVPESSLPVSSSQESISSEEKKSEDISSIESSKEEESSVSSSADFEDTDWTDDIKQEMKNYLNDNVLPFLGLGTNVTATYHGVDANTSSAYLELRGTAIMTQERLSNAEALLNNAGWDTTKESTSVTATLESERLALEYYEDSENQHAVLIASFTEEYDSTINETGSWRQNILDFFDDELDGHQLPYFYMGTTTPYTTSSSSAVGMTIRGDGSWKEEIKGFADVAFVAAGWSASTGTDPYFGNSYQKYIKTFTDGCQVEVHLSHSSVYGCLLEITIKGGIDPSIITDWPADVKQDFTDHLDGHELPLVFLNTATPDSYWSNSSKELEIEGGTWDDSLESLAITTLTSDSWNCLHDADDTGVFANTNSILVATKTFTDTCKITIKMGEKYAYTGSTGNAYMIVTIEKAFIVPEDCTDWTEATKDTFTDTFNHVIPFVYLGDTDPAVTVKSPYVTIKGTDSFNSQILTLATTAFTDAGWTNSTQDLGSFGTLIGTKYLSGDAVVASYEYDDYTLTAYVGKDYSQTAYMIISYHETFNSSLYDDWTDSVKTAMSTNLDGHILPYVYLGAASPLTSWDSSGNKLTITGELWNDEVETLFTTAFADWTLSTFTSTAFTFKYNSKVNQAQKTMEDDCLITVQCGEKYAGKATGKAIMVITIEEPVKIPADCTAWDSSTQNIIDTNIASDAIPYVYLNQKTTTATWTSTDFTDYLDIKGGTWNSAIYTFFVDAMEDASWTLNEDITASSSSGFQTGSIVKEATTTLADGRELKAQLGEKFTNSGTGGAALMRIYVNTPYVCPEGVEDWDDAVKTAFDTYFNSHYLPFFYCNSTTTFTVDSSYWSNYNEVDFYTNGKWTDEIIDAAKAAYDTEGGWYYSESVDSFYGTKILIANKDYDDGVHLKVKLYYSYAGSKMEVTKSQSFNPSSSTGSWSSSTQSLINTYLAGQNIPFVYVGPVEDSYYSSSYYYIDILGSDWNSQIVSIFEDAFDGTDWTVTEKGYAYGEPVRLASYTDDEGNRWRVVLTKNYNGKIELKMFYDAAIEIPTETADWSTSVQANLDKSIGSSYELPYIYLGVDDPSSQAYTGSCMIKGDATIWNDSLADNAAAVFASDGWDVYTDTETNYYSKTVSAYKKMDDGTVLIAVFEYNYAYGTSLNYFKFTGYDVSSASDNWSDTVQDIIDVNFGGHEIPYFYIGNDLESDEDFTYYSATNTLDLYGSPDVFSYEIYEEAEAAFAADTGWTVSYSIDFYYGLKKLTATRTYDDGSTITITIQYDNLNGVLVSMTYTAA